MPLTAGRPGAHARRISKLTGVRGAIYRTVASHYRTVASQPAAMPALLRFAFLLVLVMPTAATAADGLVTVIAKLAVDPVVTYGGGVAGLAATSRAATGAARFDRRSPAVAKYRAHVARVQDDFEGAVRLAIPAARVLYRYDMVLGGVALQVPEGALDALAAIPGVQSVVRDELRPVITDKSPKFIGAPKLWSKLGGQDEAGEGIVVGLIDTGIWPEHPSFADPDPKGKPYVVPPGTRACDFDLGANPGPPFACNGKIIGAYRFMAAYDACTGCPHGQFTSARDGNGHGSGTAGVAAGNRAVTAAIGGRALAAISGIAPRAHIIVYKTSDFAHSDADMVAAIQQAILDGVDVINFSIHGRANPFLDPVARAFADAVAGGIFVAAGAANDGPTPNTVTQLGGWMTTVAASTQQRDFRSKVTLKAVDGTKLKVQGRSIGGGVKKAPYVFAESVGDPECQLDTADGAFAGAVVLCRTHTIAPEQQEINVTARGAIGLVAFDDQSGAEARSVNGVFPIVGVGAETAPTLAAFLTAHPTGSATITAGKTAKGRGDLVASFSSRGGPAITLGPMKPDVSAPGIEVLAATTPDPDNTLTLPGELFRMWPGTSFATPHVTGAGALLRQRHPDWSPGQIQSALMTTAVTTNLFDYDGVTPATPFLVGSGPIQLQQALDPGLTFSAPVQDFLDHPNDAWTVNYPSLYLPGPAPASVSVQRTAVSALAKDSVWTLSVAAPPDLPVVVPATLALPAGESASFTIGVDKSALGPSAVRHATLTLAYKKYRAHLPITAVGDFPMPDLVTTAVAVSSPLSTGDPVTVDATVANQGAAATTPFALQFFLSADTAFSVDDAYFAFCVFGNAIPAATTSPCHVADTFNAVLAAGTYHVLAIADLFGLVAEHDETNNLTVMPGTVVVQ